MKHVEAKGARIPALGLGTWQLSGAVARRMVGYALDIGYRHIDTAQMYGNEAEVGAAIAHSPVPRDEIWLTTKIWPDNFRAAALRRAAERSVQTLGTEPDLLLLHWPNPRVPLEETVGALNEVKRRGLTRHIGISNFTVALIRDAVALSREPLVVDQVEYHPFLDQQAVLEAVRANGMALTAYSPLAKGRVFSDRTLGRIGERHGKNPGQIALRWLIQQDGIAAIPRSSREANAKANLAIFDFELSEAEMAEVFALAHPSGRQVDFPGFAPRWD
ncbi:MAG TPA: aldo/keto reductase [Geminicoccaceae bacterium]|jgi:diketogulonate reductase-like aldo/keto reductase|nr:aldo/keto reductase [Geminicoccaceae bacterium]